MSDPITQHSNHVTSGSRGYKKFTSPEEAISAMAFDIHNRRQAMRGGPAENGTCKICRQIAEGLFGMGYRKLEP